MKSESHLALFAKFWRPGKVKTRLAAALGNQLACQVYFEFLSHLLNQLGEVANHRTVVFYPARNREEFSGLCSEQWELKSQSDGDLGDKLSHYFFQSLESQGRLKDGAVSRKFVVIGSDCPRLDRSLIERAFEALDRQPVVVGPSTDGGYYLIGMREFFPEVFQRISWSSRNVLAETTSRLQELGVGFELLPEMTDIDEVEDLVKLMRDLESETGHADAALLRRLTATMANSEFLAALQQKFGSSEPQL